MTNSVVIETVGRRHYLRGNTYPIKDAIRAAGCKWDPEAKAWYSGKREIVEGVIAALGSTPRNDRPSEPGSSPSNDRPAPGLDAMVAGRVQYKGRTYYALGRVVRGRTHWDDSVAPIQTRDGGKFLVSFRDGSKSFWAAATEIQWLKNYRKPTTIASLLAYAERAKQAGGGQLEDGYYYGQGGEVLASGCGECSRLGRMCRSCEHDYA